MQGVAANAGNATNEVIAKRIAGNLAAVDTNDFWAGEQRRNVI